MKIDTKFKDRIIFKDCDFLKEDSDYMPDYGTCDHCEYFVVCKTLHKKLLNKKISMSHSEKMDYIRLSILKDSDYQKDKRYEHAFINNKHSYVDSIRHAIAAKIIYTNIVEAWREYYMINRDSMKIHRNTYYTIKKQLRRGQIKPYLQYIYKGKDIFEPEDHFLLIFNVNTTEKIYNEIKKFNNYQDVITTIFKQDF